MVKKILVMILVLGCIVILRGGVPAECQSKLQPGCFMPATPNDADSPEDREIRDILYDATVQFLKDKDTKGGGGKGLTQIACEIAAQLMCFASGVESIEGGQVRKMIGVPQKVWRKMLKENPFVPRRLLEAIWQAVVRNVEQIDFNTPEIKNAFVDIRRLWKKGGRGGGGGFVSGGGSSSSASGRAARSVGRASFPRSGDFVRRPQVVFTRPVQQPGGGSSSQGGGTQQGGGSDSEIAPSPPVTGGPSQPPTGGGTPSGQGAPAPGQGQQGLNICLFCIPQQSNQQQQNQQQQQPQNQQQNSKQQQGGQNSQQNGCTCLVDGQDQQGTGQDRPMLRAVLARIDGKLSRTESTPKNEITLDEFRSGLRLLIGLAKDMNITDEQINSDNTLGLASKSGIMDLLWIDSKWCKMGGADGYSETECVPARIGDINTHLPVCPYIVLKNLRMCLDLNRHNDEISKDLLMLANKVINEVLEDDKSLLKRLRNAHRNMKEFITGCGRDVNKVAAIIRQRVNSSCASASQTAKESVLRAVGAMEVLLRNIAPRSGKAPGTCFSPSGSGIIPRNFHAAILDGLDTYKVLLGITPLKVIIPKPEFEACRIGDTPDALNAYNLIQGTNIKLDTPLSQVFKALLGSEMSEAVDILNTVSKMKCLDLSNQDVVKNFFKVCEESGDLSLPICAAAGLAKWNPTRKVPLYTYPVAEGTNNPISDIYEYCSYVGKDGWGGVVDIGISREIPTFEHATKAKNLLLCMIYNAFNEGNFIQSGQNIPKLASLFLEHGCRQGVNAMLNYNSEYPNPPPRCEDIGRKLGVMFTRGGRATDREALTLAEILDVAYYTTLTRDGNQQVILSALTGVEGGPVWQYCIDPSIKNLHRSIEMLLKFWLLTAAYADKEFKEVNDFATKNLLEPFSIKSLNDIVDLDSTKHPLNVIAVSSLDEAGFKKLLSIVIGIIKQFELTNEYQFRDGEKIIAFGENEVSVKKDRKESGVVYTLVYSDKSGKKCNFSVTSGNSTAIDVTWNGNCASNTQQREETINAVTPIMQAFILYYMIGSPYFFADITGNKEMLLSGGVQQPDPGLQSLEKKAIFGSSADNYIRAGTLPFRKRLSWGLWRLPFLIFESEWRRGDRKWNTQWGKITHAVLENKLLADGANKFGADKDKTIINYESQNITMSLVPPRNPSPPAPGNPSSGGGIQVKASITREIAVKVTGQNYIDLTLSLPNPPTVTPVTPADKVDINDNINCLRLIFAPTESADSCVLKFKSQGDVKGYVEIKTEQRGDSTVKIAKWSASAPLICKYFKSDDGQDGLGQVKDNEEDGQKTRLGNECVSLVNSILIFIALKNAIDDALGSGSSPNKHIVFPTSDVISSSNINIKLFLSVFGFITNASGSEGVPVPMPMIANTSPADFIKNFAADSKYSVIVDSQNKSVGDFVRNIFKFVNVFLNGLMGNATSDTDAVKKLISSENEKIMLEALMSSYNGSDAIFNNIPYDGGKDGDKCNYDQINQLVSRIDTALGNIYEEYKTDKFKICERLKPAQ